MKRAHLTAWSLSSLPHHLDNLLSVCGYLPCCHLSSMTGTFKNIVLQESATRPLVILVPDLNFHSLLLKMIESNHRYEKKPYVYQCCDVLQPLSQLQKVYANLKAHLDVDANTD